METISVRTALFIAIVFASALLLFMVQPMAGKALLPLLGGVPGAWTACLLFFQAALLLGYGWGWLAGRIASVRTRVLVHVAMLCAAALGWPTFAHLDGPSSIPAATAPALFALVFLAINVGPLFALLSATSPLLVEWYGRFEGARSYFLYAASNAGSLGALLLYPLAIEPALTLATQASLFRVATVTVSLGVAVCGALAWRRVRVEARGAKPEPIAWRRRLTWVALAFVPSTLLAGATTHLSLDLAPVPLLWVVPLALYLLSFVVAFAERIAGPPAWLQRAAALVAVVLVFVTVTHANEPVLFLAALHLAFLFVGSWIAHHRLALDVPPPEQGPEFFAWIALGGVLGTFVSAVLAPAVLPDVWEYPAAIALACAARERIGVVVEDRPWRRDVIHVAIAGALIAAGAVLVPRLDPFAPPELLPLVAFGPGALYAYRWMPLRRRYTACLLALVIAGGLLQERGDRRLLARSFFGVLRVVDQPGERLLVHGTTLHGAQRLATRDRCEPQSYYVPEGPLGRMFAAQRARGRSGRTVAIGLGAGATACFAEQGEHWRFLEINPDVAQVARDPQWFTYLRESPGAPIEVDVGDGRLGLEEERDASLALVIVDAFNSDSVPVHLLTREAIRSYLRKVEPGGWVALHLSNRVLDLVGVVADVAAAEGVAARVAETELATWAVLAREEGDLEPLDPAMWRPLPPADPARAWTDAFSSVVPALIRGLRVNGW